MNWPKLHAKQPERWLLALLWILPITPLALFFPLRTLMLVALAALAALVDRKGWRLGLGLLPGIALVMAIVAQALAGLLCARWLTLFLLVIALIPAAVSWRRESLSPLVGLLPAAAGLGLARWELPFVLVGPLLGVGLFFLWRRPLASRLGRWLPLASLTCLTLLLVNITWYAGTDQRRADSLAELDGIEKVFGYQRGKRLGDYVANRARYLAPLPDGSLALGVRGGDAALLRLDGDNVEALGGGRFASDNAVVLADGLITGDIRQKRLFRFSGPPWRLAASGEVSPDQIGILRRAEGTLYTISANRRAVQAFDVETFARGRTFSTEQLCSDLDVRDDRLYLATFVGGRVSALDAQSGETLWSARTASLVQQNVAVSEEAVYVTSFLPGYVYRLDRENGEYLAVRRTGPGYRYCAHHAPTSTLVISNYLAGEVVLLDDTSLAERARVTVGRRPRWLEPDGEGGLLVVSAAGGFRLRPELILSRVR